MTEPCLSTVARLGCALDACRICTGCVHGHHGECRRTVRCPNDRVIRTCGCCGGKS